MLTGSIEPMGNESNIQPVFIDEEQAIEGALFIGDNIDVTDKFSVICGMPFLLL